LTAAAGSCAGDGKPPVVVHDGCRCWWYTGSPVLPSTSAGRFNTGIIRPPPLPLTPWHTDTSTHTPPVNSIYSCTRPTTVNHRRNRPTGPVGRVPSKSGDHWNHLYLVASNFTYIHTYIYLNQATWPIDMAE